MTVRTHSPSTQMPRHASRRASSISSAPPPPVWSVVLGEVVYGLRSALDHAVYALSGLEGGAPPSGTEFPIFKDESEYLNVRRPGGLWKARGLGTNALAVVESVQPFHHGKDPLRHPLWVLQGLCNADKHRLLNTTGAVFDLSKFEFSLSGNVRFKAVEVRSEGPVENGTELARWTIDATPQSKGQMDMEISIGYGVSLDEAGPAKGEPIGDALKTLGTTVKSVLAMLAKTA